MIKVVTLTATFDTDSGTTFTLVRAELPLDHRHHLRVCIVLLGIATFIQAARTPEVLLILRVLALNLPRLTPVFVLFLVKECLFRRTSWCLTC